MNQLVQRHILVTESGETGMSNVIESLLTQEQQARAEKIRAEFEAVTRKGRPWMPLVPQAVMLYMKPISNSGQRSLGKSEVEDVFRVGRESSREGFVFSYNCLVKRVDEAVPTNVLSGTKIVTPAHLHCFKGESVSLENAAPYALLRILWMLNHGKWHCNSGSLKGLHIYCPESVALVLTEGIKSGFDSINNQMCLHPKQRAVLEHLVHRVGTRNLNIIAAYGDDKKPMRREWFIRGRQCCEAGEHMHWKHGWRDDPPTEWRKGRINKKR